MKTTTTFESIIEIKKGTYITKKDAKEGPYPVILGGKEPAYYIDKFNHTGKAIVISRSGASAGFVSRWDEPIFITDGFLIEPKDSVDYDFVYYALKNREGILQGRQSGAAIPHITPRLINNIEIIVPSLNEQQKIAGILSAYDDLIENNQKQIKLLEEAAQRLYKEWFVDFRFPGHETAKFINGLPEGWKKERINNFFHVSIGKTPPRNEKKCFTNKNGIPWISIADMGKASVFIKKTAENLTKDAIEKYNVKIIPANSILLSFKLTVGRVSITTKEMCSNEAIAHFITDDQFIKEYCFLYLKNFKYETLGSTSSISNAINSKIVKEIPFVFPSQKILENFYNLSKDLFERIKILTDQISLLQEARDRLLPKLMNGEIEV